MNMSFTLPKGELRWISILWASISVIGSVYFTAFALNGFAAAICLFVLVMTLGVWMQSRGCAWTLLVMYSLSAVIILIREVVIAQEWIRLGKVALNVWFAAALWKWLFPGNSE